MVGGLFQPARGYVLLEGAVGCVGSHRCPAAVGRAWTTERQKQVALHMVLTGVSGKYQYGTGGVLALSSFGFLGYFLVDLSKPGILWRKSFQIGPFQ